MVAADRPARNAVVVAGSVHMDLAGFADHVPSPGSSVTGQRFVMSPGGKAGNQAVQLARLDVPVAVLARLGDDAFGGSLRAALAAEGVSTDLLATDPASPTGASPIHVGADGDYDSIIIPGAAALLDAGDIARAAGWLGRAAFVVLQLELPLPVNLAVARAAREAGCRIVLNASPIPVDGADLPPDLWPLVDLLVVNRVEAARLASAPVHDREEALQAAARLQRRGPSQVIVTLGADGAVARDGEETTSLPAIAIDPVDTVGAGDAFLGAVVARLVAGDDLGAALGWGIAAGALAATRTGGYAALPTASELARFRDR